MAEVHYCWRCRRDMPFLDEEEWQAVEPLLAGAAQAIKDYRSKNQCDLGTARRNCKPEATEKFFELTGMSDIHFDIIWHHRRKDWGIECQKCHRLFRTPKASHCANCGWAP